jgi:xanthine/CO dehydrogenase XdhC/CoxF family maturation factor
MDVDPACAMANGDLPVPETAAALLTVFDSPMAGHLRHFATDLGWRVSVADPAGGAVDLSRVDADTDVVVTDHDRPELGEVLRDVLDTPARWIGVIGSVRHTAPHVAALAALGVPEEQISRVHRPVGLNIGAHSPAEIAIAVLAGLIAHRNGRPGGFQF